MTGPGGRRVAMVALLAPVTRPGGRRVAMMALLAPVTRPHRRQAAMVALLAPVTWPRRRQAAMVALLAFALVGCSSGGGGGSATTAATTGASAGGPPSTMTVSSTAFQANAAIPVRYTCKGDNTSPPLRWSAPPAGTTELALVVDDPDAPGGTFVHWVLYGIPAGQTQLAEGSVPNRATEGRNSAGSGYTGPCPPSGPAHHYRFTVYALSRSPGVKPDDDPEGAIGAIRQAATAQGQLVGTFGT